MTIFKQCCLDRQLTRGWNKACIFPSLLQIKLKELPNSCPSEVLKTWPQAQPQPACLYKALLKTKQDKRTWKTVTWGIWRQPQVLIQKMMLLHLAEAEKEWENEKIEKLLLKITGRWRSSNTWKESVLQSKFIHKGCSSKALAPSVDLGQREGMLRAFNKGYLLLRIFFQHFPATVYTETQGKVFWGIQPWVHTRAGPHQSYTAASGTHMWSRVCQT